MVLFQPLMPALVVREGLADKVEDEEGEAEKVMMSNYKL